MAFVYIPSTYRGMGIPGYGIRGFGYSGGLGASYAVSSPNPVPQTVADETEAIARAIVQLSKPTAEKVAEAEKTGKMAALELAEALKLAAQPSMAPGVPALNQTAMADKMLAKMVMKRWPKLVTPEIKKMAMVGEEIHNSDGSPGWFSRFLTGSKNFLKGTWDVGTTVVPTVYNAGKTMVGDMYNAGSRLIGDTFGATKAALPAAYNAGKTLVGDTYDATKTVLGDVANVTEEDLKKLAATLKQTGKTVAPYALGAAPYIFPMSLPAAAATQLGAIGLNAYLNPDEKKTALVPAGPQGDIDEATGATVEPQKKSFWQKLKFWGNGMGGALYRRQLLYDQDPSAYFNFANGGVSARFPALAMPRVRGYGYPRGYRYGLRRGGSFKSFIKKAWNGVKNVGKKVFHVVKDNKLISNIASKIPHPIAQKVGQIAGMAGFGRRYGYGRFVKGSPAAKAYMANLRAKAGIKTFKKGSPEAKAFMANLRAMRGHKKMKGGDLLSSGAWYGYRENPTIHRLC